ncbi:MAG TPA: MMPL family transporter [Tepidiformaceae bacterium]|nr:MMPL family transporter [Tepidiformaceae bacterium]
MGSLFSPERLARRSAIHPWLTLGIWVALIIGGVFSASQLQLTPGWEIRGSDSEKSAHLLEDQILGRSPASETIVIQSPTLTVDDPVFRAFVEDVTAQVAALTGAVSGATNYYQTGMEGLVSEDRGTTLIPVTLAGDVVEATDTVKPLVKLLHSIDGTDGFIVVTAGDGSIWHDANEQFEKDLARGEGFGLPIALLVLLVVFGAAVAAGVPVILAMLGILLSVGMTAILSQFIGIDSSTMNMITMIGLAVGIDYTLFILSRYREERAHGVEKVEAIVASGGTASRAVLFSGITVIIALAGLTIVPANMFVGMAIGAITVVVAAVAVALTLLPALLSLLGDRINWLTLPGRKPKPMNIEETAGFFGKTTELVMRYPWVAAISSVAILLAMAAPFTRINIGSVGISTWPDHLQSVQAFRILDEKFSAGFIDPAEVVIEGEATSAEVSAAVARVRERLATDPAFSTVSDLTVNERGDYAYFTILLNGDSTSAEALDAVRRLRSDYLPEAFASADVNLYVGGGTAANVDYIDTMNRYLPIVIGFVLTLSFVLLLMVFRSIVIPVKAIIMNLLSVGAAYGMVVLVFQEGVGASLLGFQQSDQIEAFLPVFLFAVLFGLSMDYHVFLLSRIQERFLHTGDNAHSVAYGLRSTAHIITGAAAIMMVVFGGFAMGEMIVLQQVGFGLAVAVFLDASVVRTVLVPASMELLGSRNWYLPAWLNWLPVISVEGPARSRPAQKVERAPVVTHPEFDFAPGLGGE